MCCTEGENDSIIWSASLRPLPPLPAAPESAWSPLSSASSAAASLWSLLSMLVVVITTTNAFIAIIIVTIILVAYHHPHLNLQIWRSLRSYQWNEHMLVVAMLMRGIILNFFCILDGMVSIHQCGFTGNDWNQAWRKPWRERLERLFESYPGGYLSVIFDRLVTSFLFFPVWNGSLRVWVSYGKMFHSCGFLTFRTLSCSQPRRFLLQLGRQRERRKDVGREVGGSNPATMQWKQKP